MYNIQVVKCQIQRQKFKQKKIIKLHICMVMLVEFGELNHLQNVMCVQRMDTNIADRVRVHARTNTGKFALKLKF